MRTENTIHVTVSLFAERVMVRSGLSWESGHCESGHGAIRNARILVCPPSSVLLVKCR